MNDDNLSESGADRDIFFECPACRKSLVIDERAAGLVVACTDCGQKMQVPSHEEQAEADAALMSDTSPIEDDAPGTVSDVPLKERVERLQVTMEEVLDRKRALERMRVDHALCFDRLLEEMAAIQAALDRMTNILQDVTLGQKNKTEEPD